MNIGELYCGSIINQHFRAFFIKNNRTENHRKRQKAVCVYSIIMAFAFRNIVGSSFSHYTEEKQKTKPKSIFQVTS